MKKTLILILLLSSVLAFSQKQINSNGKKICRIYSEDEVVCEVSNEKTSFIFDEKNGTIKRVIDNIEDIFLIDSIEDITDKKIKTYKVKTKFGEKININLSSNKITFNYIDNKNFYIEYEKKE